jgi:replicative DNA helicase
LITAANDIISQASDSKDAPQNVIDSAEQRIFEIRQGKDSKGLTKIDEIILGAYDRLQKLASDSKDEFKGFPSGFSALDNIINGLNRSDLIILAARPGMGKTSFALNIATNMARKTNKDVAIFSLEMSKEQLATRILSSESRVDMKSLQTGELTTEDWERLAVNAQQISSMPIYVDDTSGLSVSEIKAKARRLRNLGLIVIDYLQLMEGRGSENRVQEVSAMTRALKIMAKDLNVPVITLSQLSRASDRRDDKRPLLADLRESGSIEQDADIVMFLYRDGYYNPQSEKPNIAECIVAKNRHGETKSIEMSWDGKFTKFTSLEKFKSEN